MNSVLSRLAMTLLRPVDPETAHGLALRVLRAGLGGQQPPETAARLSVLALGLHFPSPIGLAAGFDKNAVAVAALTRLGWGFVETGTVTPLPQPGNPRPRLFRLREDRAVINRNGFNNAGIDAYLAGLAASRLSRRAGVPVGANIGINKEGAEPERDYPLLVAAIAPHADYIVLNVSSPNTPGLRDLQAEDRLRAILAAIATAVPSHPPLLVKIAPDLSEAGVAAVVEAAVAGGVAGLIVSNTTLSRPPGLRSASASQTGGLSGAPLLALSNAVLAQAARAAAGRLVLIGVGGISSGRDVLTKLRAGATLVQLYTAFAYDGPALLPRLRRELLAALDQDGFATVTDAIGADLRGSP